MIFDLAWEFPPNYVGGLGVYQAEMFKLLAKKFEIVATSVFQPGDEKEIEEVNGIEVYRIKPDEKSVPVFSVYFPWNQKWFVEGGYYEYNIQSIEIASSLKNVELVHSHDWLGMLAGYTISRHRNVPWIVTIHSLERGRSNSPNGWVVDIEKIGMHADRVIAVSNEIKKELLEIGYDEKKIEVIYNGIDTEKFNPNVDSSGIRKRFGIPEENKVIFFVGRPVREKGLDTLIESFRILKKDRNDISLVILSSGEIPDYPEGVIHINKFVREEDRIKLIKASDVFTVPSLYEPFGIVTLEGMALGKPTIGSRTGGIMEIIRDGKDGLLAEPGNAADLAEKLRILLNSKNKKMSESAIKRAHQFSWKKNALRVSAIYNELLSAVTY